MGKGVALMFRGAFPENTKAYEVACRQGKVHVGRMFVTENRALLGPRWIINFPTKKHWRHPSQLAWVRDGLEDLVRVIRQHGQVRREIEAALGELSEVDVVVFEPTAPCQKARGAARPGEGARR